MVEPRLGNVGVFFWADVDENGIRVESAEAKHGDQQGGLVAADAVAVVESQRDIVRLIAGGFVFDGDAHVADVLRDKAEDGLNLFLAVGDVFRKFPNLGNHFGRGGIEARLGEFPIPFRKAFPVGNGAEQNALNHRVARRHPRFGEHARNVADFPAVENPVSNFLFRGADGFFNFVAQRDVFQRKPSGCVDFINGVNDGLGIFQNEPVRPGVGHDGFGALAGVGITEDIADSKVWNTESNRFLIGVVDVGIHLSGADGFAHVCFEIDLYGAPIRLNDGGFTELKGAIADVVSHRDRCFFLPAFFRENFESHFAFIAARSVGFVPDFGDIIDQNEI